MSTQKIAIMFSLCALSTLPSQRPEQLCIHKLAQLLLLTADCPWLPVTIDLRTASVVELLMVSIRRADPGNSCTLETVGIFRALQQPTATEVSKAVIIIMPGFGVLSVRVRNTHAQCVQYYTHTVSIILTVETLSGQKYIEKKTGDLILKYEEFRLCIVCWMLLDFFSKLGLWSKSLRFHQLRVQGEAQLLCGIGPSIVNR